MGELNIWGTYRYPSLCKDCNNTNNTPKKEEDIILIICFGGYLIYI